MRLRALFSFRDVWNNSITWAQNGSIDHIFKYFVRKISTAGPWAEIATSLYRRMLSRRWIDFTYHKMVNFLLQVKPQLDNLGDNPIERQVAADELVLNELVGYVQGRVTPWG